MCLLTLVTRPLSTVTVAKLKVPEGSGLTSSKLMSGLTPPELAIGLVAVTETTAEPLTAEVTRPLLSTVNEA